MKLVLISFLMGTLITSRGEAKELDPTLARQTMVKLIQEMGITDARVLQAMAELPRHVFVPQEYQESAYRNTPLHIGEGQAITPPQTVAFMLQECRIQPHHRVLEIGTGTGYMTSLLSKLSQSVYTIEIIDSFARQAKKRVTDLGIKNVYFRTGDGFVGWPEAAPFDVIILSASLDAPPEPLAKQLKRGGILLMPIGQREQKLVRFRKGANGLEREVLISAQFVPMSGQAQDKNKRSPTLRK